MWTRNFVLTWLAVLAGISTTNVGAVAVVTNGICCRLKWKLGLSYPPFLDYCKKIAHFDPDGTTYDCGGNGFVMYRPGRPDPHHPGRTLGAEFELKAAEKNRAAVFVMLHCDTLENPHLANGFIVGADPYFCESKVGLTFGPLISCQHPRVSYRMTPTGVSQSDCR